ncbi:GNAT family N-acetyltransferase [Rhizobium sp. S152]|uniref:GNAT family N-acetyltransferase n=1 Tax=Rhizobium sp. S152 TaxID=3055038 RepID=UPI0025A9F00C|nr:GNAT family N-acetyltransferase [Rhizobium sp. S152]MDM9626539.1 GNAT family N-acetyltransferase [Rhizobium sp. S152]
MRLSAPELLAGGHDLSQFHSGVDSLDDWLLRRARSNQISGASRTYVLCSGQQVVGYYSLSSGGLAASAAPGSLRRNMPDPIPMAILGRLAIDLSWQGKGLGSALLQDAVLRTAQAAHILGIRGILVHALSEDARAFYERYGFIGSPLNPMTLVMSLKLAPTFP